MKILSKLLLLAFFMPLFLSAQEEAEKKYHLVELTYIKVKVGMEAKFEAAVKAHNDKFHADAPYKAYLYSISTGNDAGWYVWEMRGMTFSEMDSRPDTKAHGEDWNKNIAPHIQKYGRNEIWRSNYKLSHQGENSGNKIILWLLDIERGEYYRFKAFMEKVIEIHKEQNESIYSFNNSFPQNDGRDFAIVWPFDKWGSFDEEDWSMKDKFDEKYGEGAWQDALEEWEDVVSSTSQEVWTLIEDEE